MPSTTPKLKPYRELPVALFSDWDTVGRVKGALAAMEQGSYQGAASMVEAMLRDDRVAAVLDTRINGVFGLPHVIEPAGDKRRGGRVVKDLEEGWSKLFPQEELAQLLFWGTTIGFGLGELVWYDAAGKFTPTPRLKFWHPQWVVFRWDTLSYWVTTSTGQIPVEPGNGQWVLYTPFGFVRGHVKSLVRSLAVPWLVRQWAVRDWARWSEVHGLPIKKAIVPTAGTDEDKEQFIADVASLGAENTIRLPQSPDAKFDVELMEAVSESWKGFEALASKMESSIAIRTLGQNLTTEVKGGAYAAAKVHERVRQDVLEFDAKGLATCLRDQVLRPWAGANYGDPESAPDAHWLTDPPEDAGAKATTMKTTAEALNALGSLPVDKYAILEGAAVPLLPGAPTQELPDPEADDTNDSDESPEEDAGDTEPEA